MKIDPRNPADRFLLDGKPTNFTVGDFWRWGISDLLTNITRGAVAEFIVANALDCPLRVRNSWGAFDLCTRNNIKVEVKSASYRQAWYQKQDSAIRFGIAPTQAWNPETNESVGERKRHADVYVFCLLDNREPRECDPLELSRWQFYVLSAKVLDAKRSKQKTIGLTTLRSLTPCVCVFKELADAVERVFVENPARASLRT